MTEQALKGIKVADFTQVTAGNLTTKILADYGATVVVVENLKITMARTSGPFKDGIPGPDRATQHAYNNPNKYGMSIDLSNPQGLVLAKKLVKWADVIVENYRPGVMERLGLGYESLKEIKPDIVMLRLSSQGQTGPLRGGKSYGFHLQSLFGFANFTGWPDRNPAGLMFAYPDFFVPFFAISVLVGALDFHAKTGQGQMIDLSQGEVCAQFMAPYLLESSANGTESGRMGNQHDFAVPHGIYPCKGEDRWCAIAVFTDEEWLAFCQETNNIHLAQKSEFSTFSNRKIHEIELNAIINAWTINLTPEEITARLQQVGVSSGIVKAGKDLTEDPQLNHRGFFWTLPHGEIGNFIHMGEPSILSETPAQPMRPAPCLGEHSEFVCTNFLGMSDDEFMELMQAEVFT